MVTVVRFAKRASGWLLPLALAACSGETADNRDADTLDDELADPGQALDPVIRSALQDPIMVDPLLTARSNADAIRPPSQPYSAPIPLSIEPAPATTVADAPMTAPAPAGKCPECAAARDALTLGALAARQPDRRTAPCAATLHYAAGWADRLPADLPLHPAAHVVEAAGSEANGCSLRAVSFTVVQPMEAMLNWYRTRAAGGGYASRDATDGARHVLIGTRARDGSGYTAIMTERDGGTVIDLIVDTGR